MMDPQLLDLTLKMRVSERPREEYFGTKGKLVVIVQQNLNRNEKKMYFICSIDENLPGNYVNLGNICFQ